MLKGCRFGHKIYFYSTNIFDTKVFMNFMFGMSQTASESIVRKIHRIYATLCDFILTVDEGFSLSNAFLALVRWSLWVLFEWKKLFCFSNGNLSSKF
jgi:hypothetical protein